MPTPRMDAAAIERLIDEQFPQARALRARIEEVGDGKVRVRLGYHQSQLRPGGTLSGPVLMTLADTAMYYLVLSMIGPAPLAVTTSLHIDFLRRPAPTDVIAEGEMLRLGSRLAVGRVTLLSEGDPEPVAHAVVTYAIPRTR